MVSASIRPKHGCREENCNTLSRWRLCAWRMPAKGGGWDPDMFARKLSGFSVMPQYRLASDSSTRFPAAMQDGLTAYMYLLGQGISPRDIVLSGDSAGANLVVALARYQTEEKGFLPLPRASLSSSPWLDLRTPAEVFETHRTSRTTISPARLLSGRSGCMSLISLERVTRTSHHWGMNFRRRCRFSCRLGAQR